MGESEIGRPDLHELPAGTQPGQRQGGIGAGADNEVHLGWQVVQQEGHARPDVRAVGQVVVVEDQVEHRGGTRSAH